MKYQYHLIIIGGGSAGLVAASGGSSLGAKICLIESNKMGGDCLNYGCVPSKAFLRSAHLAKEINNSSKLGFESSIEKIDLKKIMSRVKAKIAQIAPHDSVERFTKMGVDVKIGKGEIIDNHTVKVNDELLSAKSILIATGSYPRVPQIPGLDKVEFLNNENIFDLEKLPEHLIIIGGGPIGLELGQGFKNLGSAVTIIDHNDKLFPKDDPEVWPLMKKVFEEDGIKFVFKTSVKSIEQKGNTKKINLEDEKGSIECDAILVSAGRIPDLNCLGGNKLNIDITSRGFVKTNAKLQTNVGNIYAAGDVTGPFQFTHMAGYHGGIIVQNAILGLIKKKVDYSSVPWTTYTSPEVAHVGYTEPWAKQEKLFVRAIKIDFAEIDRAITEDDEGFIKLILGKKNRIIGATIVGAKAGEMIPLATLAIKQKLSPSAFSGLIFSYPTEAEIYKFTSFQLMRESFKPWMKNLIKLILPKTMD